MNKITLAGFAIPLLLTTLMLTSCAPARGVDVKNLEAGVSQFLSTSTADPQDTAIQGKDVSAMRDLGKQTYEEMVYVGLIAYIFSDISYQITELDKLFANAQPMDTNWTGAVELRFGLLRIDINAVYKLNDSVPPRMKETHLEYTNACADYEMFMNLASNGLQDMNQDLMVDALEFLTDAGEHIQLANDMLTIYEEKVR